MAGQSVDGSVAPVADPGPILATFLRRPDVHPYGIADVAQLWGCSRWWRDGEAVVGLLDLPGAAAPVLYAVSAGAQRETLALLARLEPGLPDHLVVTGPRGLAASLGHAYGATFVHPHVKLRLASPRSLPPAHPDVVPLGRADTAELQQLLSTDPAAGDFFHPGLLDSGFYLGRRAAGRRAPGRLVAAGGVHVVDLAHGVAAIGNVVTHPAHRRRGLARAVVATLSRRLRERVAVVGLNVREDNQAARALYHSLGFRMVLHYEECELVRRRPPPSAMMRAR